MNRKLKTKTNIYAFLKSSGVLENGSHEDIQKVRKEYWSEYKRKWRKQKRKIEKELTIHFNPEELAVISLEAKRHKLSRIKFIKHSCFAYINKSFIVPDSFEVKRISQLLSMLYSSIRELLEEDKLSFKSGRDSLEMIQKLEREILPLLNSPKLLRNIQNCI
ncbi:MAG: hypothetical protein JNL65_11465 [Saprospiraceae bacterium]|nr:hypothetical protein [Saprospiraceae bacterium]